MTSDLDDQFLSSSSSFDPQSDALAENELDDAGYEASRSDDSSDLESVERGKRRRRHVRLFCFSCNRYEGHSVASRNRMLYSFAVGLSLGLYYFLGRFSCHCCGSVRLARRDWLNPRFWYRTVWLGGVITGSKKSKTKSRSRSKG